jgi:hypothetical protein
VTASSSNSEAHDGGGRFDKVARLLVVGNQAFDLLAQRGVVAADVGQEGVAFGLRAVERGVEKLFDLFPAFGSHRYEPLFNSP